MKMGDWVLCSMFSDFQVLSLLGYRSFWFVWRWEAKVFVLWSSSLWQIEERTDGAKSIVGFEFFKVALFWSNLMFVWGCLGSFSHFNGGQVSFLCILVAVIVVFWLDSITQLAFFLLFGSIVCILMHQLCCAIHIWVVATPNWHYW